MNNRGKKSTYVILGVLLVAVAGLSIAYAALSTTLNINFGTVTQTQQTWNVHFKAATNVAATEQKTSTNGFSCGKATVTASTVTVGDTQLSKPDDKCTWALQIQNEGTIDAKLGTITAIKPTSKDCTVSGASMVCGNVTYKLSTTTDGGTLLAKDSVINKNTNLNVYLVAMYNDANLDDSAADTHTSAGFTLVYNQK